MIKIIVLSDFCNPQAAAEVMEDLIQTFKNLFTHKTEYGNEYFEGDYKEMLKIIFESIVE